ncbi:MAG: redoxin domain-containing protein [Saprospiraceae bacterium]
MKKVLLVTIFQGIFLICLLAQQDSFKLKGWTNNLPDATKIHLVDFEQGSIIDSTIIVDNQFSFTGATHPYKQIGLLLRVAEQTKFAKVYVENSNILFDARQTDFENAKVDGSILQTQADELTNLTYPFDKKWGELNEAIGQLAPTEKEKITQLDKEMRHFQRKSWEITQQFIANHPDYFISVQSLSWLKAYLPRTTTVKLYEALSPELKATKDGQFLKNWLANALDLTIGDQAPDFQAPNLAGKSIALSDFKGKYVLIEFGLTGCLGSRQDNPILLKAYQQYQEAGFEILSVWLDTQKEPWAKTVETDNMIWTSINDLQGARGPIPTMYNVTYYPTSYLINQDGIIIAKDLREEALEERLAELFNGQ